MVADALVYHPTVAHYLKFVATTVGRDKLLRAVQYFSRFYAWYLYRTNHATATIKPWDATKKQLGLARKVLRLGKNVEHFKAAAVALDSKQLDPVLRYCAIGRQLGYGFYLSFDALTYLDAAGIKPNPRAKSLSQSAYRAWLFGIVCNIVAGSYTLYNLNLRESNVNKKDGEGVVEAKRIQRDRAATQIQLISDLCDFTVPSSALGYLNLDDGFVGLAGTASSLLGAWGQWKKTA